MVVELVDNRRAGGQNLVRADEYLTRSGAENSSAPTPDVIRVGGDVVANVSRPIRQSSPGRLDRSQGT
ncbi:hypothetical protein [Nocardia ignorata]|uniref:hypothetical protein n=1 Tax=Nocardia ignorata TaxID=145285 RepID=UPI00105C1E98|nr:hypothetical protein [Nocardia ignorata]